MILAGARDSIVRNNLIINNATSGVQVVSMIDDRLWPSGNNQVRDNVIAGSGRADLALGGPVEQRSCFEDNDASTSVPFLLEVFHTCDGINLPLFYGLATSSDALGRIAQVNHGQNTILEHGDAPKPDLGFDQLPGGAEAPVSPAVNVFASLDFEASGVTTPELPAGVEMDARRPVILGIAVDGGFWPVLMGALMWWIPLAVWVLGGIWALSRIWTVSARWPLGWSGHSSWSPSRPSEWWPSPLSETVSTDSFAGSRWRWGERFSGSAPSWPCS